MKNNSTHILSGNIDKPVLVFIHYFGGAAQSWKWVIDILSSEYYCVALSLPGFGNNPMNEIPSIDYYAAYIQQELNTLEIHEYSLIGHSMGGKIALQVALNDHHEKKIQQLILLAPSPPTIEQMPDKEKERMLQHPNKEVETETVNKIIVQSLSDDKFTTAVHTQSIINNRVWRWWILEGMNTPLSSKTKQLTLPIALFSSIDDPCITPEMIQKETMPNLPAQTDLLMYKKIGHLYPLEEPEWLSYMIHYTIKKAGVVAIH